MSYMFCQTENIGHDDHLNPNFDRLAIEISICVLSTISIRIPLVSPASELTPEQDSTGKGNIPPSAAQLFKYSISVACHKEAPWPIRSEN